MGTKTVKSAYIILLAVLALIAVYSNPSWAGQKNLPDLTRVDSEQSMSLPPGAISESMVSADTAMADFENNKKSQKPGAYGQKGSCAGPTGKKLVQAPRKLNTKTLAATATRQRDLCSGPEGDKVVDISKLNAQAEADARADAQNEQFANSLILEADQAKKGAARSAKQVKKFNLVHRAQSCPFHIKGKVKYVSFSESEAAAKPASNEAPSGQVIEAARAHGRRVPASLDNDIEAVESNH